MLLPRNKTLRVSLIAVVALLSLAGVLMLGFQIAVTRVPEYRVQLQEWLSEKTGLVIEFSGIRARVRLYGPELVFDDAVVRTQDRTRVLATARRGSVGFDLWTSLAERHLTAGRFTLDAPQISLIRTREGRIRILGHSPLPQSEKPIEVESLPVGEIRVRNAVVSFRDEVTGRGPWSLSGINFVLSRARQTLALKGNASLPDSLGDSLEFSAELDGDLKEVGALVSRFTLQGEGLELAGWADVLPNQWFAPETGRGSIELEAAFQGTQPASLRTAIDFDNVSVIEPVWLLPLPGPDPLVVEAEPETEGCEVEPCAAQPSVDAGAVVLEAPGLGQKGSAPTLIAFDRLRLTLNARHDADGWHAALTDIEASRRASPWRAQNIEAHWTQGDAGSFEAELSADRLVLDNLWPLLAFLPESEAMARLRALRATGTVSDLEVAASRADAQAQPQWSLRAQLQDVGVQPVQRNAGVEGVSARIEGNQDGGVAELEARDAAFVLPRMFRTALTADSVDGRIEWTRLPQSWRIGSEDLRVSTVDGGGRGRVFVTVPLDRSQSPVLELEGSGDGLIASSTSKYLPANKLSPKALHWLDTAFVSGKVRDAQVRIQGPTRSFPFRGGEGEFIARGRIEAGELNYHDGWAPAQSLETRFEFRNEGLRVWDGSAQVHGLKIGSIKGEIPDFKRSQLSVAASGEGDMADGLAVLQQSPIADALGEAFLALRGTGRLQAEIDLYLPLKRIADRRTRVAARVSDATLRSNAFANAPLTSLSGSLTVKQTLPMQADLTANWLGGPLRVEIAPRDERESAALLTASGRASASALAALWKPPSAVRIEGETDWRLTTELFSRSAAEATDKPQTFTFQSDLQGLQVDLPYPVGKSAHESRALRVDLEYDADGEAMRARSSLGEIRSLLRFEQRPAGWRFDRGSVRADTMAAALPAHEGLSIEGRLDRLVLDDWLALRGEGSSEARLSDVLKSANLRIGMLQLFGYQFPEVRGLLRARDAAWKIDVAGPSAEGELSIPENMRGTQPLTLRLNHLVVSRAGKRASSQGTRDPHAWPNLHAFVEDFRYEDHSIGAVEMRASRVPLGIRLDALTIVQEAVRGEAQGQWLVTPDGERSEMKANIVSTDVAATLRALGYTPVMEAKRGEVAMDLRWDGGFDSDFLGKASGTVQVAAEDGQLLSVQPGAGRMLGLFSVAALPRRLALDFSDLTDEGLAFDDVHGDFELREGNAYTSNLLLSGPAAEIGIAGRTGLGARDYDQVAVVTGDLGVSLPVAGALAGGPAIGAALLLFSQVFKEPLKGITRGYYRITGPWDEPVVERVDAAQARDSATASGKGDSETVPAVSSAEERAE